MISVAESIREQAAAATEIQAQYIVEFWLLARAAALGEDVDPGRVVEVSEKAGKTVDQFQAAAEVVAARIEALRRKPEGDALLKRANELEEQRKANRQKLHDAIQLHNENDEKMRLEIAQLIDQGGRLTQNATRLSRTCPYPDLTGPYKEVLSRRMGMLQARDQLAARIRENELQIENTRRRASRHGLDEDGFKDSIATFNNRLDRDRAALAEFESQIREINIEVAWFEVEIAKP